MISNIIRILSVLMVSLFCLLQSLVGQINTDKVMAIGKNALYFEDYILAIRYFNQVISVKPYLGEPYFCRGIAKISLEDYRGAETDCTLALERNPFIVNAFYCRGIARINLDKYEDAMSDFDSGLELDPSNKSLLSSKAAALAYNKNYQDAIQAYTKMLSVYPKTHSAYINRSRCHLLLEDTVLAMKDADSAVVFGKYNADSYAIRGGVLYSAKEYKRALADFNEAVRLSPLRSDLRLNRAITRYQNNDIRGAMSDYDFAINQDEDNVAARYNRGLLRAEIGDINKAIEDFDRVLMNEPSNDQARINRAMLEVETGEIDKAIADINHLIEVYPDYYILYSIRGRAKEKNLDRIGAEKDYGTAFVLERKVAKEDEKTAKEKTRLKSDKDIKSYHKLVAIDPEDEQKRLTYNSESRGKVQNQNKEIVPQGDFVLTFYSGENPSGTIIYSKELADIVLPTGHKNTLKMSNENRVLTKDEVDETFTKIEELKSSKYKNNQCDMVYTAELAVRYFLAHDYQNAEEEWNQYIVWNPKSPIALLSLSSVLSAKAEREISNDDNTQNLIYTRAADILKSCVDAFPDFAAAYYNMANIALKTKDYKKAVELYTTAIEKDKDMAAAYFNRGLTYIFLANNNKGVEDLSKAGELGLYSAYNIIKRYGEK